jgi:membrane dipeptidase
MKRGYGAREIGLLWSGNVLRVWRQVLRGAA